MSGLLHSWLAEHAGRRPDAVALVMGQERLTYGQLEETTNRIARLLREHGCRDGDRVGLLMPKAPTTLACMLGVLKAGGVYVPLDPVGPAARARKILDSCESRLLLAAAPAAPLLEELLAGRQGPAPAVGWMAAGPAPERRFRPAFSLKDADGLPAAPVPCRTRPEDAAHILFTSGSTGAPKGVVITHANVWHFVAWANGYFGADASDRNSGHSPLQFDLSTYDIYGSLAAGAQLHLVPPELNVLPNQLAEFIRANELTQWFSVPSVLGHMAKFDVVRPNDFPALKRLLWCGEVFPTPNLVYWMKRLPKVRFTNLYGPTEATIASGYYTLPDCPEDETAPVPIGTGCGGEELLVLDEQLRPVAAGGAGDLYIRGVGLSPGYWRDPEKTRAAFLPNPHGPEPGDRIYKTGDRARVGEDGLVYFLGRLDAQIKSRGYRIELGEIESALSTLPQLRASAVVAVETNGFEGAAVCCAFVPAPPAAVTPGELAKELGKLVPRYMLPLRWLALRELPQNANGKVDKLRLKELFRETLQPLPGGRRARPSGPG
jgi:amino acid adenylation domain-containing protein